MRRNYFFSKIVAALILIMVVVVYFFFYFIPSLEAINRYKRQVKDMNLKIADFKKASTTFSFPDQRERGYFLRLERELTAKIPEVADQGSFIRLVNDITAYFRELAERDAIYNLVIESGSRELKFDPGALFPDKRVLDDLKSNAAQQLSRIWKKRQIAAEQRMQTSGGSHRGIDIDLSTLVKGINYQTVALLFSGELKKAMNFINHLSWAPYYLVEDRILVCIGDTFPYYIIFLKIYYIDVENAGGPTSSSQQETGQQGLIVDDHSWMLLRRIPTYLLKKYPQKELPQVFAKNKMGM